MYRVPREQWRELERLCAQHDISAEIGFGLLMQIEYLLLQKHEIAPERRTITQRAKQLEKVAKRAASLIQAVEALEFQDRLALDDEFFGINKPGFQKVRELAPSPEGFDPGGVEVPAIRDAALLARGRIAGAGKAGAASSVPFMADHVRCIAQVLMPAGIKPTNAGTFKDFCDSVFACAGLKSPAKAVRHFMKHIRPEIKAVGRCL